MKKIFCILITLAVLFSLIACSNKTNDMTTFQAIILEIHDDYYLVEPVKGSAELNSADQITVSITNINVSPQHTWFLCTDSIKSQSCLKIYHSTSATLQMLATRSN